MIPIRITDDMCRQLIPLFAEGRICRILPLPLSGAAFLSWAMLQAFQRPVVVITDSMKTQDEMFRNLTAFAGGRESSLLYYPAWDSLPGITSLLPLREGWQAQSVRGQAGLPGNGNACHPDIVGDRLNTLNQLRVLREPAVIVTCVQALIQLTPAPDTILANTCRLTVNEEKDPDALIKRLGEIGYEFVPEVQHKGQAAWRGGLLDVWPPPEPDPLRIEFFGSTVETIRSFDPTDQRSFTRRTEALIAPKDEWGLMRSNDRARTPFMTHLPKDVLYFWFECAPDDQDSLADHSTAGIPSESGSGQHGPRSSTAGIAESAEPTTVSNASLPGNPDSVQEHAVTYEGIAAVARGASLLPLREGWQAKEGGQACLTIRFQEVLETIACNPRATQCFSGWTSIPRHASAPGRDCRAAAIDLGFRSLAHLSMPRRDLFEPDLLEEQRRQRFSGLEKNARDGASVHLFFNTQGALDRFRETHPDTLFQLHPGLVSDGFTHDAMRLTVIGESLLMGQQKRLRGRYDPQSPRRSTHRRSAGETITDWTSIEPGDLVVHVDHGIGKYLGLYEIKFNGQLQETLAVEYADRAKLYVPVSQSHLLSRYIGAGKHHAHVHRLGGKRWSREKLAAERAVHDLASCMLQIQAMRESMEGFAFPSDSEWQHEFEAAFPYEETADQEQAIEEVKRNMEARRPMDRLICGDVGYGKTEVALRASFKAVTAGKQVAILVPTTVLAQQHFEVFVERMGAYPINVELLCRFRTHAQQEHAVRGLARGSVDIAIGTHRLLQPDIRFKDLGLVIIDEEQRFGVAHKERLKRVRQLVDVLTLTATPIPRTLYMSLTGARDISMIQTSPEARLPIETIVTRTEDRVVRDAVLRELNRGGQVYYLHNRITTIEKLREWLQRLVPEARIAVAHGQTPNAELSRVMHEFEQGRFDLLLCTTIIQSGLDIPNVNTILIDRADRFGMADLYQLRGRVGRSSRNAYAYLLLPSHGHLMDTSRKRIHAILQHSGLGAGFRLAIRDLEIRGAGNLLGPEQSGHIAAIGFDLYCQLLKRTIAQSSQGEPVPGPGRAQLCIVDVEVRLDFIRLSPDAPDPESCAFLPYSYVEDERLRIGLYRKIASAACEEDIQALRAEFQDRFGPIPAPLDRLLKIAAMRVIAAMKHVTSIESKHGKIMLKYRDDYLQANHRFPCFRSARPDERLDEIIRWLNRIDASGKLPDS